MNEKALKTLEYTKIIDQLTEYASTEMGKQMCRELQPSCDLGTIRQSQTETTDALTRVRMKGSLSFGGVKDVRGSMKRLEIGSSLGIPELLAVSSLLTVAARAQSYGRHEKSEEFPDDSLDERFRALDPLTPVNNEIKRCLPSEDEVSDDASPGLAKVRRSMKIVGGRVHTQLNSILNSSRTYLQDAVITMRDGRYCLPVKAEYKSQVPGMVHDQSSTGSTVFIEPLAIVKLNNELRELEIQEKREIEFVLAALSSQLMPYTDAILSDLSILAELDFIFAKAALSRHYNCVEPKFNNKRYINIKDGRHPLLNPKQVVPINIWVGDSFAAAKFEITRQCKVCGETFVAKTIESWYCTPKCSKIAWKRRKDEEQRLQRLDEVVKKIPKSKEYITVPEAYALFGISKETLYRLIRKGTIPSVNAGERQTLLSKEELMKLYPLRKKTLTKPKPIAKLYSLEPKDCYTIGEITEKFLVNESTVYLHIRKYSIPTRQIGNFVYVPKKEIDNLYKGVKR